MSPMEGEKILLSQRQLQRGRLMKMVGVGKINLKESELTHYYGVWEPVEAPGCPKKRKKRGR